MSLAKPLKNGRKKPLRLLITGFGPFPGVVDNPSAWLVRRLQRVGLVRSHTGVRPEFAVFPTEWRALPHIHARAMSRARPDLVVHFGVSARARAFHIEALACNRADGRPDARGHETAACPVVPRGPDTLATTLPVGRITGRLCRLGLPAQRSHDAGDYICNMTYFLTLARRLRGLTTPDALFVHIPPFESGALTQDQLLAGARALIAQAIYQAQRNSGLSGHRGVMLAPDLLP
jgi:pyroglutamyl-peptidase